MSDSVWFVYLLMCTGQKIYTGVTPDLPNRMRLHREGKGAEFTRMNRPVRLLAIKPCQDKRAAMQLEAHIKRVPAAGKHLMAELWLQQYPIDQAAQDVLAGQ